MKKVNVTYSNRGFPQFGDPIETDYGHWVRVYGSSAAMKDCVWMSVDHDGISHGIKPAVDAGVHMDLAQATQLRDHLSTWINMINGYDDAEVEGLRGEIAELSARLTRIADDLEPWRTREEE